MAAGDTKFSHITVNANDDDDVVIQAGARPARPAADPAPHVPEAAPASEVPAAPERSAPAPADAATASRPRDKKGYRPTTADDLKAEPMSTMQKAIIVLALVGIAAFVAYYLFFMR